MSDTFDLAGLITQARDEVGPDPAVIAERVAKLIPGQHLRGVVAQLLVDYCRAHKPNVGQVREFVRSQARSGHVQRSAKVAALQQHARLLKVTVCVGPSHYLDLGECGVAELEYAAKNRREKAAQTLAAAADYEELVRLLRVHKKKKVRDLPPQVLDGFLRRESGEAA